MKEDKDSGAGSKGEEFATRPFVPEGQEAGESGYRTAFGAGFDIVDEKGDKSEDAPVDDAAVAGKPDCRFAGRDTPVHDGDQETPVAGCRKDEKGDFYNTSSYNTDGVTEFGEKGGIGSGKPANRQSGNNSEESEESGGKETGDRGDQAEEVDPISLLPRFMRLCASNLAQTRNTSDMSAAVGTIAGFSSCLGKGVHTRTLGDQVNPNLHIMMAGPTGNRKKGFHVRVDQVAAVLRKLETESRIAARKHAAELKKVEKALEEARAKGSKTEITRLTAGIEELLELSTARSLAFGDDATAPMIARQLVKPGSGGCAVVNSQEGTMALSRIAGSSKNDPGYGALYTKGFNDPEYSFSRYDDGRETHGGVLNPRLFITLSIQNALVPSVVSKIEKALGLFQRFNFVVEESRRELSPSASLFAEKSGPNPIEAAYLHFVDTVTRKCWSTPSQSMELRFSDEAEVRMDELMRTNEALISSLADTEPEWVGYVCRWTEQVIKLVQTFHVASCADSRSGEVDWDKVAMPISLATVERTIAFHAIWSKHTRRFYDLWIKPVETGIEGLTCEKVKAAMFKALEKSGEGSKGVQSSDVLKYLPKGTTSKEFIQVVDENPDHFGIIMVGDRGKKLYLPKRNIVDFPFNTESEGGLDAA